MKKSEKVAQESDLYLWPLFCFETASQYWQSVLMVCYVIWLEVSNSRIKGFEVSLGNTILFAEVSSLI